MKQAWMLGFQKNEMYDLRGGWRPWLNRWGQFNALSRFQWNPNHYIKPPTRAGKVAQWVKPLMLKHEEPRLDPQNSGKHLVGAAATCQLRMQEAEGGHSWSKLAKGTSWTWWTLVSERDPASIYKSYGNWRRHLRSTLALHSHVNICACVRAHMRTPIHLNTYAPTHAHRVK